MFYNVHINSGFVKMLLFSDVFYNKIVLASPLFWVQVITDFFIAYLCLAAIIYINGKLQLVTLSRKQGRFPSAERRKSNEQTFFQYIWGNDCKIN